MCRNMASHNKGSIHTTSLTHTLQNSNLGVSLLEVNQTMCGGVTAENDLGIFVSLISNSDQNEARR